jgi:hypothetical protein
MDLQTGLLSTSAFVWKENRKRQLVGATVSQDIRMIVDSYRAELRESRAFSDAPVPVHYMTSSKAR